MTNENAKTKDRYYIYSHVKTIDSNGDGESNQNEKSRKIRSSQTSNRKQVSKNISMVLENLLMSYENSQLPTHGQGLINISDKFVQLIFHHFRKSQKLLLVLIFTFLENLQMIKNIYGLIRNFMMM